MITKFLKNIIKNYNKPLSIKYFHNTNLFTYNLFSAFYKKFLLDKKKLIILSIFLKKVIKKLVLSNLSLLKKLIKVYKNKIQIIIIIHYLGMK